MKKTITWINAETELPKRDVPVLVLATSGKQTWVQASHRMSRGWSTISKPGVVRFWAAFPSAPTIIDVKTPTSNLATVGDLSNRMLASLVRAIRHLRDLSEIEKEILDECVERLHPSRGVVFTLKPKPRC